MSEEEPVGCYARKIHEERLWKAGSGDQISEAVFLLLPWTQLWCFTLDEAFMSPQKGSKAQPHQEEQMELGSDLPV